MKSFILTIVIATTLLTNSLPSHSQGSTDSPEIISAQKQMKSLGDALTKHRIYRLEVFYMPWYVETIADLTPEQLQKAAFFDVKMRGLSSKSEQSLKAAVERTKFHPPVKGSRNFKIGCVFYGPDNSIVCSIFIDAWGKNCVVNGSLVGINGVLPHWFQQNVSSHLDEF